MDLPESTLTQNPSAPPPAAPAPDPDAADIAQNKDLAAFSYLWVMSVVVYLLRRKSPFIRYHAKQAMVLFALSIVVWLVPVINRILELGVLCLMVWGFANAAQGKRKDVPIIGPLSRGEISIREAWKQVVDLVVWLVRVLKSLLHSSAAPKQPPAPSSDTPSSPPSLPSQPS